MTGDGDVLARDRRPRGAAGRGAWAGLAVAVVIAAGVGASAGSAPGASVAPGAAAMQPPAVEEFVPIDELPEGDRLPAAGFLIVAYSIVWILAFGYFWRLSRRQSEVEGELARLSRMLSISSDGEPPPRS